MIPATAFTILFALWCSRDDAQQIAQHSKIHHGMQWGFRAALVVAVCYWWASWWLALGMAGLFSAVFRWELNGRRGLDWRYVSPLSNVYDTGFIVSSILIGQLDIPWRDQFTIKEARLIMAEHGLLMKASEVHWIDRKDGPDLNLLPSWYRQQVHRAGTMAYVFEALLFFGVVVAYLCRTELAQRLAT